MKVFDYRAIWKSVFIYTEIATKLDLARYTFTQPKDASNEGEKEK